VSERRLKGKKSQGGGIKRISNARELSRQGSVDDKATSIDRQKSVSALRCDHSTQMYVNEQELGNELLRENPQTQDITEKTCTYSGQRGEERRLLTGGRKSSKGS